MPQTAQNVTTAPIKDTVCHLRFDLLIHALKHKYIPPIDSSNVRRKKTSKLAYETVKPELLDLAENLNNLSIDNDQLIALCMLVGTDYNVGGIKGIGPKNALTLIKKHKSDFDELFKEAKWSENFKFPWTDVFYLVKKMPVTDK